MLSNNPFSILAESVSPLAMQSFVIAMIVLIALGTIIQMIHHLVIFVEYGGIVRLL